MSIKYVTDDIPFDAELVVFTQPSFCAPCRALKPHLEKLAERHPGLDIVVADLDNYQGGVPDYVRTVPYLEARHAGNRAVINGRTTLALEKEFNLA